MRLYYDVNDLLPSSPSDADPSRVSPIRHDFFRLVTTFSDSSPHFPILSDSRRLTSWPSAPNQLHAPPSRFATTPLRLSSVVDRKPPCGRPHIGLGLVPSRAILPRRSRSWQDFTRRVPLADNHRLQGGPPWCQLRRRFGVQLPAV